MIGALLLVGGIATGTYLLGRTSAEQEGAQPAAPSPSPSPSPTPSGSPTPSPKPDLNVTARFVEPAASPRLMLTVVNLVSTEECVSHGFPATDGGAALRAYLSDCDGWAEAGHDIYMFLVELINRTNGWIRYDLQNFSVVARSGEIHKPVDVRGMSLHPGAWVPPTGRLKADEAFSGWLAVDANPDFVPGRLVYKDKRQRLVVLFVGKHAILPSR